MGIQALGTGAHSVFPKWCRGLLFVFTFQAFQI